MPRYVFDVTQRWEMYTTCEVEAENEIDAKQRVLRDSPGIDWSGSLDWGDCLEVYDAVLMDVIEEEPAVNP